MKKILSLFIFLFFFSFLFAQKIYYNYEYKNNFQGINSYSIDSCKNQGKTPYIMKNNTTDRFTYSTHYESFIYCGDSIIYFLKPNNTIDSSQKTTFDVGHLSSATYKDTLFIATLKKIAKIVLPDKARIDIGQCPTAQLEALWYVNRKLMGISVILNEVVEVNTQDASKSKVLFKIPSTYIGAYFSASFVIETCDTTNVYLIDYANGNAFYILDFVNKDLVKVCNSNQSPAAPAAAYIQPPLSCLDLDRNNSTIKTEKDYKINLCASGTVPICDQDIAIKTRPGYADSLHIWLDKGVQDIGNEVITYIAKLPLGVIKKQTGNDIWFYFPKDFAEDSISSIIKNMRYTNTKPTPTLGIREVKMYLYTGKIVSDPAIAFIHVGKSKQMQQNITTCKGKILTINGLTISKDTAFCEKLIGLEGCDSTYCITVKFADKVEGNLAIVTCNGASYDFYGQNLTQSGDYEHIIKNATACDSTVKLTLSVLPKKENIKKVSICEGTFYDFYGTILSENGIYEKIFKTKNNCDSLEKLVLEISALPVLTLPADITLSEGTSIKIEVTVKGDSLKSIAWLPATFLDRNDTSEVTVTPTESIDYQVIVRNKNDCEAKANIKVFVKGKKKVFAPTAFSPNDDGFNDFFEVFLKADEGSVEKYEIYDRWGNLIYKNSEPWNGADASIGVFTYVISIKWNDGKTTTLSGDVLLSR